ncbi:uncharacterized protein LOC124139065 isoform X2 [Haliotis rufescens]|uniref:uncharacterized protein LOC124139065 isoform X2 n=1 Tax=Haliotis rufescens TaxID=6454 RepID=UPI00201E8B11|nr:uncharacterized protein LOC124139065 isoform X2 [Haliotis rufescens]
MPFGRSKERESTLSGLSGCFMSTYKIQANYVYSEKHFLYVDNLSKVEQLPPPHPPSCSKEDIFDPRDFVDIDRRADAAPSSLLKEPYPKLISYLLEEPKVKSKDKNQTQDKDHEVLTKVRAIYRWVTAQHVDTMTMPKKSPDPTTPLFQFWRIKNKKGNFAQLVSILCRLANVTCVIIHGKMKGSTYDVGQPIDDKLHYGEWNAVLIGGDWWLLNTYWGACAVGSSGGDEWLDNDGKEESLDVDAPQKKGFMFTCDENYFLCDPRQIISTHLPACPQWQLRSTPITPERFEEMVFLKDRFFNLGMSVLSHKDCVITSTTGEVEIFFGLRKDAIHHKYYCLLFRQEGKTVQGFSPKYDRYLLLQRPKSDQLSIKIRSPVAGTFRLELVGMDTRNKSPGYDYDWICLYKIKFTKAKARCQPYPDQPALGWGPGLTLKEMGLTPISHSSGMIRADSGGEAEVEFAIHDKEKLKNMKFIGRISKGGVKEEKLKDRVVYRTEGDRIIFNVRLPRKGEYALKLYATKDEKEHMDENICNYIVVSEQKKSKDAYPRGFDKGTGLGKIDVSLGIEPLSHKTGIIKTAVDEVKLDFQLTKPVEHSCSLVGTELMISDAKRLVSEEVNGDIVTYTVRLPKLGNYGFKLIAKPTEGGVFENVVDYVISYVRADEEIRTPIILTNIETPVETPGPEDEPEEEIKKRMDVAIVTQDEEELVKAIADMKEVTNSTRSARKEKILKKSSEKTPRDENGNTDAKTPRNNKETPRKDKTPRDENDNTDAVAPENKEKTPRDCKTPRGENETLRNEETPRGDKKTPRDNKTPRDLTTVNDDTNDVGRIKLDKIIPRDKEGESIPIPNGNAVLPAISVVAPLEEEPEVIKGMIEEVDAQEKERAELAKEELARAERELQIIKVRKELMEAIAARELQRLIAITTMIRDKNYQSAMMDEMKKAKSLIERLQHIRKLLHAVLELDQNTVAEIKGYAAPPPAVSKVLSATLLILGHFVEETKEWIKVQNILSRTGKESLKRRVEKFDINKLEPDIAMGAKVILKDLTLNQVRVVSAGAATFYVWTKGLINEIETRMGEDIHNTRPRTSNSRRARRMSRSQGKQAKLTPLTRVDL